MERDRAIIWRLYGGLVLEVFLRVTKFLYSIMESLYTLKIFVNYPSPILTFDKCVCVCLIH